MAKRAGAHGAMEAGLGLVMLLAGCTGVIGAGDGTGGGEAAGGPSSAPTTASKADVPLARLTRAQYTQTVHDLFAPIAMPDVALPADLVVGGFDDDRGSQTPSPALVEALHTSAVTLAQAALTKPAALLGCSPKSRTEEDDCASQFLARFAPRAYRHPLGDDDRARLTGLYASLRPGGSDFTSAMTLVLEAMLQSPYFLYRVELGDGKGGSALGAYEVASRLSYFLWNTMPDDALFAAAASGALLTPSGVESEARRMLADPRAHAAVRHFFEQWLELDKIDAMQKDATMFPTFGGEMRASLRRSVEKTVDDAFFTTGSFDALLTDSHAWVDDRIAPLFGVPAPGSMDLQRVAVDPAQRAGILTHAGIMAGLAHETTDAPVLRGVFVLDRFLCAAPPPPPANVPPAPSVSATKPNTTRDRFAQQHEQGACAGCHHTIDGVGFGFEHYDALGQWRTRESGFPVDASGWLPTTSDVTGTFDGAVDLAHRLATSKTVQSCFASQWARYALGVGATGIDTAALAPALSTFVSKNLDMRELVVALVTSDAFRNRTTLATEGK